jgi:hypothetical protein
MLRALNVESIKLYMRQHTAELAIVGVMVGISLVIAFAAGGDIGDALARTRKR